MVLVSKEKYAFHPCKLVSSVQFFSSESGLLSRIIASGAPVLPALAGVTTLWPVSWAALQTDLAVECDLTDEQIDVFPGRWGRLQSPAGDGLETGGCW